MATDLRSTPRYPCRARCIGSGVTRLLRGEVSDVSLSGLRLVTRSRLALGKVLHLEFELPTGPVEAVCEVRRQSLRGDGSRELGLRFVRISVASIRAIGAVSEGAPPGEGLPHYVLA